MRPAPGDTRIIGPEKLRDMNLQEPNGPPANTFRSRPPSASTTHGCADDTPGRGGGAAPRSGRGKGWGAPESGLTGLRSPEDISVTEPILWGAGPSGSLPDRGLELRPLPTSQPKPFVRVFRPSVFWAGAQLLTSYLLQFLACLVVRAHGRQREPQIKPERLNVRSMWTTRRYCDAGCGASRDAPI